MTDLIFTINDLILDSFEHFKIGYANLYVAIERTVTLDLNIERPIILDDALNARESRIPLNRDNDPQYLVRDALHDMNTVSCDLKEQIQWSKTQVDVSNPTTSDILRKVAEFKAQHAQRADNIVSSGRFRWPSNTPSNRP